MKKSIEFRMLPNQVLAMAFDVPDLCEKEEVEETDRNGETHKVVRYHCYYNVGVGRPLKETFEQEDTGKWVLIKEPPKKIGIIYYFRHGCDSTADVAKVISTGNVLHVVLTNGGEIITTNGTIELYA